MRISFLGLGIMGSRMAHNLIKANYSLTVWNRSEEGVRPFTGKCAIATTPGEAVRDADLVITMLSDPKAVEDVAFGTGGFTREMKSGSLWVDCSTVDPLFSTLCRERAEKAGVRHLDAPVAGTKGPAESGSLLFLIGANEGEDRELEEVLNIMGQKIIYGGGHGKGTALKMLLNTLLGVSIVAFSEVVHLGEKMGLKKEFLLNFLPETAVVPAFIKGKLEYLRSGEYETDFPLELMHKDLHLASKTAYDFQQNMFAASLSAELFRQAQRSGLGKKDFTAIFEYLGDK